MLILKGPTAYESNDCASVLREFIPLAEQGIAFAQSNLATVHALAMRVVKDHVFAHMWGNISASVGEKDADKFRELVEKVMTPSQLENAQNLGRECVRKKFKKS